MTAAAITSEIQKLSPSSVIELFVLDLALFGQGPVRFHAGTNALQQRVVWQGNAYEAFPIEVEGFEFNGNGQVPRPRLRVALVTWNDPEDFYRQKVEYVEDAAGIARYGIVQSEVVALGCTSRGQAHRVGKWLLYSEQSESEIVTFRTGLEGAVVRPGDVIKVADPVRGGMRLGGRIAAASASTVTLDQDLPADLPWRLSVVLPTGKVEDRLVGPIYGRALTVSIPFSAVPQPDAIWVLSSSIIEPQLFRVVAVAERDPGVHEVTALAHNSSKFDAIEKGLALQPRSITILSDMPSAPTGLTMQESLYRVKDQAQVLVQVSWNEVQTAVAYRLSYRVSGGNFVSLPLTSANYIEIRDAQEGAYEFSLRAIGITRKESAPATLSATVLGKTLPPSDVAGFMVQRRVSDLLITWDGVEDADLAGYEVRVGPGWDNGDLVAKTAGTQMVHDQSAAGLYPYHIRAYDTLGNYSANVTTFVLSLLAPSTVRQFDVVQSANRLEFRWQPNPEPEVVGYLWPTPVLREMSPFNDDELAAFADFSRKARALFDSGATQCTLPDVDMSLTHQFNAMLEPYRSLAPKPQFAALEGYIDEVYRRYIREALGVRNAHEVRYVARILPVVYGAKGRRVLPHYHHTCDHVMCLYLEAGLNRKPMAQRDRRIGDGELILCDPRPMASFPFWEKTRVIDPVPGLVVLHPSQVWHETNAFTSDGDRTLLAITLKVTSHNYTDLYQPLGDTPCSSKSTS